MFCDTNSYTVEEREKINFLRSRISVDVTLNEDQVSDHYLVKWLRARSLNVVKAEEMLRKSLQWREENGVDTILETLKVPEHIMKKALIGYLGDDPVTGLPMLLVLEGRWDLAKDLEEIKEKDLIRLNIYFMEYIQKVILKKCSEKARRPITSFIEIMDLDFYDYRMLARSQCRNFIIKLHAMFDSNYPETVSHVSLINAPKLFFVLFNLLKPFIFESTLSKVFIYGNDNWQEEFGKRFPVELLPPKWGGTKPGRDEFCSGDPIWIFGLDENYFEGSGTKFVIQVQFA